MIYMGTCSWKYSSWEGLVYDAQSREDLLAQYAKRYRSVEVDQWFWSLGRQSYGLPDPDTVLAYDQATDKDFRFTVKCPNTLTLPFAYGSTIEANPWFLDAEVFYRFVERLGPLVHKIGLFMFQFSYLNQKAFSSRKELEQRLEHFMGMLPDGLAYAVEIRNPTWLDATWFDFLARNALTPVLLSGYWMDGLEEPLKRFLKTDIPTLCIRLHGDDRSGIEQETGSRWDKLVVNKNGELASIAPLLVELAKQGRVVYINVNNHYEGSAPLTIEKLMKYLLGVYE